MNPRTDMTMNIDTFDALKSEYEQLLKNIMDGTIEDKEIVGKVDEFMRKVTQKSAKLFHKGIHETITFIDPDLMAKIFNIQESTNGKTLLHIISEKAEKHDKQNNTDMYTDLMNLAQDLMANYEADPLIKDNSGNTALDYYSELKYTAKDAMNDAVRRYNTTMDNIATGKLIAIQQTSTAGSPNPASIKLETVNEKLAAAKKQTEMRIFSTVEHTPAQAKTSSQPPMQGEQKQLKDPYDNAIEIFEAYKNESNKENRKTLKDKAADEFQQILSDTNTNIETIKKSSEFLRKHHVFTRDMQLVEALERAEKKAGIKSPNMAQRFFFNVKAAYVHTTRGKVDEARNDIVETWKSIKPGGRK